MMEEKFETEYPDWYHESYRSIEQFQSLSDEGRAQLVGNASAIFGTLFAALTPQGQAIVGEHGKTFTEAHLSSFDENLLQAPRETLLYLMLGIAIETIGIQQMRIQEAEKK